MKTKRKYDWVELGGLSDSGVTSDLEFLLNDTFNVGVSLVANGGLVLSQSESDHPYGVNIVNCLKRIVKEFDKLELLMEDHENEEIFGDI